MTPQDLMKAAAIGGFAGAIMFFWIARRLWQAGRPSRSLVVMGAASAACGVAALVRKPGADGGTNLAIAVCVVIWLGVLLAFRDIRAARKR